MSVAAAAVVGLALRHLWRPTCCALIACCFISVVVWDNTAVALHFLWSRSLSNYSLVLDLAPVILWVFLSFWSWSWSWSLHFDLNLPDNQCWNNSNTGYQATTLSAGSSFCSFDLSVIHHVSYCAMNSHALKCLSYVVTFLESTYIRETRSKYEKSLYFHSLQTHICSLITHTIIFFINNTTWGISTESKSLHCTVSSTVALHF